MTDHSSSVERRITLRLLGYWERMRAGRTMPTEQDIDPEDIRDLWDNCFLIHIKDLNKPDYNYTYLGEAIEKAYEGGLSHVDPTLVSPHASKLSVCYTQILDTHKPVVDEGEFINQHNETVKYRQCLLPLGEHGRVEAIFGGMRFKVFSA